MKSFASLLSLVYLLTSSTAFAAASAHQIRDRARRIVQLAYNESSETRWLRTFDAVFANLETIVIPLSGYEFTNCDGRTLGFADRSENKVLICRRAVEGHSIDGLAQIAIHEAAHLSGLFRECDATAVEMRAMTISGVGLAFRNDYTESCGFK